MEFFEFFEYPKNCQSDDESVSENESSINDCPIPEQIKIIAINILELPNNKENFSSEKEQISSEIEDISSIPIKNEKNEIEKEHIPSDIRYVSSILIKNENDENSIENKETMIRRKRGKRASNENQKTHNNKKNDNRLAKIQNNYFSFIIDFINELMEKMNIKYKFVDFNYKAKKKLKMILEKN